MQNVVRVKTDTHKWQRVDQAKLRLVVKQIGESTSLVAVIRSDKPDEFAQAAGSEVFTPGADIAEGQLAVEYRTLDRHFQAFAPLAVVSQILLGWAFDLPGWKSLAKWRELDSSFAPLDR